MRLDVGRYEWGEHMAEFIAIGTAIRHRDGGLHRAPNGRPFTSDLSGQDFWTLLQSGHRPVGMVLGSCVYHVAHRGMLKSMRQAGQNVELPNFGSHAIEFFAVGTAIVPHGDGRQIPAPTPVLDLS